MLQRVKLLMRIIQLLLYCAVSNFTLRKPLERGLNYNYTNSLKLVPFIIMQL